MEAFIQLILIIPIESGVGHTQEMTHCFLLACGCMLLIYIPHLTYSLQSDPIFHSKNF